MHIRHVAQQNLRRLTRRYSILRRLSLTTTFLTLLWLYVLYWGERSTYTSHIRACQWASWERWPAAAAPHHLVFIADPQLVDPHTYPGRPWPLSSLTETYTDMYMARNFRLINSDLDPDSVVFLGDLFDGGREWATSKARPLKPWQTARLEKLGVIGGNKAALAENQAAAAGVMAGDENAGATKRSMESYHKAISRQHDHHIDKKDHFLTPEGRDLKDFVYGENGRWSRWNQKQWDSDYARFSRIFFEPDQLYPHNEREAFAAYEVPTDEVSLENGARNVTWQEYATSGGKQRRLMASLPGNHDLGFGMGVQWPVRDRFEMHFGDTNRIDVIGNHTFVSLDSVSLAAASQFVPEGGETSNEQAASLQHIWKPTMDFLENMRTPAGKAVTDALHEYYPDTEPSPGFQHAVSAHDEVVKGKSTADLAKEALQPKPQLPIILLTHVPLYRDPDTDCGHLRERGHALSISAGYQYQNVITRSLSSTIVSRVSAAGEIVHVFSGDDHDYCDVTHRYNIGVAGTADNDGTNRGPVLRAIKEITVKSFSWAMGVRKPGFLLVSLWNPVDAKGETVGTPLPTVQTHLCLLPDQLGIFITYAMMLGFTVAVLFVRAVWLGLRGSTSATENEDADTPIIPTLPYFQSRTNGSATKSRLRASSTSTSSNHGHNSNSSSNSLGVQRSYKARTRSVSPALGYSPSPELNSNGPLIEKAGYYPQVRWADPADESDEEKSVGLGGDGEEEDSQAKWKRRRRTGKIGRVLEEFVVGVALVGAPAGLFYAWLVKNG